MTGASGGAMRRPCDRMPAMFETREPCHKSFLLANLVNGLNRLASPLRTTLNTCISKIHSDALLNKKMANYLFDGERVLSVSGCVSIIDVLLDK